MERATMAIKTAEGEAGSEMHTLSVRVSELELALQRGKWIRLALFLGLLGFMGAVTWGLVQLANRVRSKQYLEAIAAIGQKQMEQRAPTLQKEVEQLTQMATPILSQAFSEQAKADMPLFIGSLDKERDAFINNFKEGLRAKLNQSYDASLNDKMAIIRQVLPEIEDPIVQERLEKNLKSALEQLIEKYYIAEIDVQAKDMFAQWEGFPSAPSAGPDQRLEDMLLGNLLELASYKLSRPDAETRSRIQAVSRRIDPPAITDAVESAVTPEQNGSDEGTREINTSTQAESN
jgi:hypothetical protein